MNDTQWAELVRRVLREAGGEETLVTGAKLKQILVSASGDEHALDSYLRAMGMRFKTFLERTDGVEVKTQVGTDMLVGLEGAGWPTTSLAQTSEQPRLRQDLYEALTVLSEAGYHYSPSTDEFASGRGDASGAIAMPPVTFEDLIDQRRKFAESLGDSPHAQALIGALEKGASPLANYKRELARTGLSDDWHRFKFDHLYAKLSEWASTNGIAVSPAWHNTSFDPGRDTPQQIITRLVQYMSEQEIRNMNVPFRAVEAYFRDLTKGRA